MKCLICAKNFTATAELLKDRMEDFNKKLLEQLLIHRDFQKYFAAAHALLIRGLAIRKGRNQFENAVYFLKAASRSSYLPLNIDNYGAETIRSLTEEDLEAIYSPKIRGDYRLQVIFEELCMLKQWPPACRQWIRSQIRLFYGFKISDFVEQRFMVADYP